MAKSLYKNLTVQVLAAVAIGLLLGAIKPHWGEAMKPFSDGFIRLVTMVISPIIFLTIVVGITKMGDMKKVGRVGGRALIYFEIVTTLALAIGLLVVNVVQPGKGVDTHLTAEESKTGNVEVENAKKAAAEKKQSFAEFLLDVIPKHIVGAFAEGKLLQILFFSVLFGMAMSSLGMHHSGLMVELEHLMEVMFRVVAFVMKVAPLGAFGAMAFTVGKYGLHSLAHLALLMACVYLTMALFIFVVLGTICRCYRFSLWRYLVYVRHEIMLVLGTSSSESALPRMMQRLEELGCNKGIVGMVIPAGYSFNLDGTSIYLSMAIMFLAQAFGMHLGFWRQLEIMGILMLTSKGAAAVTGGGLVTLAATLGATKGMSIEWLAIVVGVDRFMSEARAITNLIGNGVATIVVSKMEGEFDEAKYQAAIRNQVS